jgi:lipoate-protein ligase A
LKEDKVKILEMPGLDPYANLAAEDYILSERTDDDYLLLWRNDNTIVVGLHQNTLEEINLPFVERHKINVVRRRTGGGAVYHDLGNLNFSFITDARDASRLTMERFTLPIVRALSAMGLKAEASGRNDILANGLKISGNAQCLHGERILHHGTLLFDTDLSVAGKALKVKPEKFISKSVKSVRARIGNIGELLDPAMSMEEFYKTLLQSLVRNGNTGAPLAETLELTGKDLRAIAELRENKYATWEWNYGRSPDFNFRNMQKYAGGFLEVLLKVENGYINSCKFFGDFMALRPAAEVAEKLLGVKYTRKDASAILATMPLAEFFGSIGRNEILDCLFNNG